MRHIEVETPEPHTVSVCVNRGWIVVSIIFMVLSVAMALLALHNAKLVDCEYVYPDKGRMYCVVDISN